MLFRISRVWQNSRRKEISIERCQNDNKREIRAVRIANTSSYSQEAVTFKESLKRSVALGFFIVLVKGISEWKQFHRTPLYRVTWKSSTLFISIDYFSLPLSLSLSVGLSKTEKCFYFSMNLCTRIFT